MYHHNDFSLILYPAIERIPGIKNVKIQKTKKLTKRAIARSGRRLILCITMMLIIKMYVPIDKATIPLIRPTPIHQYYFIFFNNITVY